MAYVYLNVHSQNDDDNLGRTRRKLFEGTFKPLKIGDRVKDRIKIGTLGTTFKKSLHIPEIYDKLFGRLKVPMITFVTFYQKKCVIWKILMLEISDKKRFM